MSSNEKVVDDVLVGRYCSPRVLILTLMILRKWPRRRQRRWSSNQLHSDIKHVELLSLVTRYPPRQPRWYALWSHSINILADSISGSAELSRHPNIARCRQLQEVCNMADLTLNTGRAGGAKDCTERQDYYLTLCRTQANFATARECTPSYHCIASPA